MIRIYGNYLPLNNQVFGNFSLDKSNNQEFNWFQLILLSLLSLIDNNSWTNKHLLKGSLNSEIFVKGFDKQKDFPEKSLEKGVFESIKIYLGKVLENNNNFSNDFSYLNSDDSKKIGYFKNILTLLSSMVRVNVNDKENFSFDEEITSLLSQLSQLDIKGVDLSRLDKILENISSNFNEIDLKNPNDMNKFLSLLRLQHVPEVNLNNQKGILAEVREDVRGIESKEILNQTENFNEIKSNVNVDTITQNLTNEDQNHKDIFLTNNFQGNKEVLNFRPKDLEKKGLNVNSFSDSAAEKSFSNQNKIKAYLDEDMMIFKNTLQNEELEISDLPVKKVKMLDKGLKIYVELEKNLETEGNLFHKMFYKEFVKNGLEMNNIIKGENPRTLDFYRIPQNLLQIVKEMVLEIYPEGEKKALIKLEPQELGFLDLEIKVRNKDVEIIVKVEKSEILQEIKQNLPYMKANLEDTGLNLKEVQVFLGSGFDNKNLVKNFERENYPHKLENEKVEGIESKEIKSEDLIGFYNRNGKYYYIV